jgi:ribosomal protein S18 acetylase RimI-like enzyme
MNSSHRAVIRRACASDLAAIEPFDVFAGDRAREIGEGRMLVAQTGGMVAAYLAWLPGGFVGRDYITCLCVRPGYRRRGVAMAPLRQVEAIVARGRLFVSTEEDNAAMLALLGGSGWTRAGAVAGVNADGKAELFLYKDLSPA